jgi:glycosyltransferase involved in cell wall biosynthesis
MRVVMVSKALVVGAYQRKAEELARLGVELTVLIPPAWNDRRGRQVAEQAHTAGYDLRVIPLRLNGNYHLHHYPTLPAELARLRPDVLHMDEEPYNLATFLALRAAAGHGIRPTFFTWQNLHRRYPWPVAQMEQSNYRRAAVAIAGNEAAAAVLRAKGYGGEVAVIPQFGVDPQVFAPAPAGGEPLEQTALRIGYAGGLLPEKGIDLLLRACARLAVPWRLLLAGEGEQRAVLEQLAGELGVMQNVQFLGRRTSDDMVPFYQGLDLFVLPSRTLPNWMEQFGRVLVEAMACSVPVIGSSSGEIPRVIGDGGLVFPEGDAAALAGCLQALADSPAERARLGAAGRRRVLAHYTMRHIAEQTAAVYRRLLEVK